MIGSDIFSCDRIISDQLQIDKAHGHFTSRIGNCRNDRVAADGVRLLVIGERTGISAHSDSNSDVNCLNVEITIHHRNLHRLVVGGFSCEILRLQAHFIVAEVIA